MMKKITLLLTGFTALSACQTYNHPYDAPLRSFSDKTLCAMAIADGKWDQTFPKHVDEAQIRGFSLSDCIRITAYRVATQSSPIQVGQSSSTSISRKSNIPKADAQKEGSSNLATRSNRQICVYAISANRPKWEDRPVYMEYVREANRRGLSESRCARLAGRLSESQIAAAQSKPIHPVPTYPRSDWEVCTLALQKDAPVWKALNKRQDWVREAKRRGFSEAHCARLTNRQVSVAQDDRSRQQPKAANREAVMRTQRALIILGLYDGRVDGVPGPKTRDAIRDWKRRKGLDASDRLNDEQLAKLEGEAFQIIVERRQKPQPPMVADKPDQKPQPPKNQNVKIYPVGSGSGFAVSSNGHVVTNAHVIEGCSRTLIHADGSAVPATAVKNDPVNDLALLKGDFEPNYYLPLSANNPSLLQEIYVAGYPFGRKVSASIKVTKGIVSSLTGLGDNSSRIQIDAALQPGNSGGPILDEAGNVVGVAVSGLDKKYTFEKDGVIPENINFGIKSSVVKSLLEGQNIRLAPPNTQPIEVVDLGRKISGSTYYLSCWMTVAQIKRMKAKKVMFENIEQ